MIQTTTKTMCYKCELDVATNRLDTDYPSCKTCFDGSTVFSCDFCDNGLATEQVDYSTGQREWWCSSCVFEHGINDSQSKMRYVNAGAWFIQHNSLGGR